MTRIFIDCDVAYDFLAKREPFYIDAATLFNEVYLNKFSAYLSSLSYSHLYYFLHKSYDRKTSLNVLRSFRELIKIATVDESMIDQALASSFNDFEDAIQYYSATAIHADYIISRNSKDFKYSKIKIKSPKEFVRSFS